MVRERSVLVANARFEVTDADAARGQLVEGEPDPVVEPPEQSPTTLASATEESPDEPAEVRTHGAGPGGRLASLGLIVGICVFGLLALYWGIGR